MSWQNYVDQSLIGTNKIDQACIHSLENGEVWATSPGISLINNEYVDLVNGFTNPAPLYANGIYVNGDNYLVTVANERSIYGKNGKSGVINVKTNKAIITGTYTKGIQSGEAAKIVERFADYLIGVGY